MAKNLKLHIKNIQLAEAIDLQGLKEKLSKQKHVASKGDDSKNEESTLAEKDAKKALPKKAKKSVSSKHEAEFSQDSGPEAPVFSTLEEPTFVSEKTSVSAPTFSTLELQTGSTQEKQDSVEESFTPKEISLSIVEDIVPVPVIESKPVPVIEPKIDVVKEISQVSVQENVKPFLSARKENPYNLGPVVREKPLPVVPERRSEKVEHKGRTGFDPKKTQAAPSKPLWEPLKTTQGTKYQPFASQPKPQSPRIEAPKQDFVKAAPAQEKVPFEPKEKKEAGFVPRRQGERPFQDRSQPFQRPQGPRPASDDRAGFRPRPRPLEPKVFEEPKVGFDGDELPTIRRKPVKDVKEKEREREKESRAPKKIEEKHVEEARLRRGLALDKDEGGEIWRKKRPAKNKYQVQEIEIVRPKEIAVRLPITIKDLAQQMKLKSSQLISKLFLSGLVVTLNDVLDDETTVQLLGQEFGCSVTIDTAEEKRIRITDKSIRDEIAQTSKELLQSRPPVVAFMGHVDHGKTSIIDKIRKSNRVSSEVGAITQHIGAFVCETSKGKITILDTPGHEAFDEMRKRGAVLTDIVVLVVAGDEGMKEQTIEAMKQAKEAAATIVIAINKCDKPAYDQDTVYRQLAEQELLPEAWGGQTVTVRCSAQTGEGIDTLVEMIALQAEVLELQANPLARARGTIIEAQMHKGLGPLATLLVQNGTLHLGDSLVFESSYAKVKSMRDEFGHDIPVAGPSTAVRVHGLSSMPSAGEEFIVVSSEKEAKEIAEVRLEGKRQSNFLVKRRKTLENMMEQASSQKKKELALIVRADVQGSLEALCNSLSKIVSSKIDLNIISTGVGEISESDVQLASASKAVILGYHTQIEAHADQMIKESGVKVCLHNIIYHAHDDIKEQMKNALDKISRENYKGKAEVKALFKSSQLGTIAGCIVVDGTISRHCKVRVRRGNDVVFESSITSLKRFKEDVREVSKGTECGIVISHFVDYTVGDIIEAFEVEYLAQEL